ncbi:MAG: PTS sugar transporter subunit IIA [Fibrobacterota bacterium]
MRLSECLSPAAILCGCQIPSKEGVLEGLTKIAAEAYGWDDCGAMAAMVREREAKMSTGIGMGIAIPHCRSERLDRVYLALASVPAGVEFGAPDKKPVRLVFLLVSPLSAPGLHVQALAMVSRIGQPMVDRLVAASTPTDLLAALSEWEAQLSKK